MMRGAPAQQWLLRGDSGPSLKFGGPPCGEAGMESIPLRGSREGAARSEGLPLAMSLCSVRLLQDNIVVPVGFHHEPARTTAE
jgi:hypothetical protein